jgi:uncharacterized damage-inducible protein DinB
MMDRLGEHREAFRYNRWANQRTLGAAATLSDDDLDRDTRSSFPSVRRTLVHILASEWIWLRRWKGESPTDTPAGWQALDLMGIRSAWDSIEVERDQWLSTLSESDLDRVIEYRNTRGEPHERTVWLMLRHVVNHSSYHRGQVTTMLRQLGASAASTDLVYFGAEP